MYRIGIDLGGTNIAVGLVTEDGELKKKVSCRTCPDRAPEEIISDMAGLIKGLLADFSLKTEDIDFCGIATPGIANRDRGEVEYSCNLPFKNFPIVDVLRGFIPFKAIAVENDANAAAKGEAEAGAAKGYADSVLITLGTGVGGGIIIGGKILSGFNFSAAELGHMVIEKDGRQCTCGRRGCWETYSSATGLANMTREYMQRDKESIMWEAVGGDLAAVNGKTAFAAARKGDKLALEVVDVYIGYLACGLTNIVNALQPEILSIGGGISGEGDYLLRPLAETVSRDQYSRDCKKKTRLAIAKLGNDAGIIGAALLDK